MNAIGTSRAVSSPVASHGLAGALLNWWHARTSTAPRRLRLLETLPLGPKRSVALLELDGRRFLAGTGVDGVHTLLEVGTSTLDRGEQS